MPQVRLDLFPAIVTFSIPNDPEHKHQISKARVIVTQDRLLIAIDSPEGPKLVYSGDYAPDSLVVVKPRTEPSHLITITGQTVTFKKDEACGCGSRLRSWNPFKNGITSSQDPTE